MSHITRYFTCTYTFPLDEKIGDIPGNVRRATNLNESI